MDSIACRPGLPYVPFVLEHLIPRVPVLVPGAAAGIPAVETWTPAGLRERFGDRVLRVDVGGRIEKWTLGDFITRMEAGTLGDTPHPPYLRNASLVEFLPELIPEVPLPAYCTPNWLESDALVRFIPPVWTRWVELFISGPATRFPRVHVDSSMTHAWVIGVHGRKKFWAWPPQKDQPSYSIHSEEHQRQRGLDCLGKDLEEFFDHAKPIKTELGPGDFLFLPTGWWHTAESVTTSISLSGNFVNETNWDEFVECWFRGLRFTPGLESIGQAVQRLR
jgi:histone arginine demethylase JMJD6